MSSQAPARARAVAATGLIPSGRILDLLTACVAEDRGEALTAYAAWRASADIEQVGPAEFRLLPLLSRRLAAHGFEDDETPRLKGVYRQALFRNNLLAHRAFAALDLLDARGIPHLVVKGLPLLEVYYRDRGARWMEDVDVIVPEGRADEALDAVENAGGWRAAEGYARETNRLLYHCVNYVDAGGLGLDLHWHLLLEACFPGADRPFWNGAATFTFHGRRLATLAPTDTLFLACVHGARAPREGLVRWIPDAAVVIRSANGQLDWDRVVGLARHYHLVAVVEAALAFLSTRFRLRVPGSVLADLGRAPVTAWDLAYLRALDGLPRGLWAMPAVFWADFWMRLGRGRGAAAALRVFPHYLRCRSGSGESTTALLAWAGGRAWRRVRLALARHA